MTTAELEQLVKIRRDGRIDLWGLYNVNGTIQVNQK